MKTHILRKIYIHITYKKKDKKRKHIIKYCGESFVYEIKSVLLEY